LRSALELLFLLSFNSLSQKLKKFHQINNAKSSQRAENK